MSVAHRSTSTRTMNGGNEKIGGIERSRGSGTGLKETESVPMDDLAKVKNTVSETLGVSHSASADGKLNEDGADCGISYNFGLTFSRPTSYASYW
ncbi:hypothetical protein Tco_0070931 [Tanacetum coccineum]